MVGADGMWLLARLHVPYTPRSLRKLAEIEVLRRLWEQHYELNDGEVVICVVAA
jgi:hypothetical protein